MSRRQVIRKRLTVTLSCDSLCRGLSRRCAVRNVVGAVLEVNATSCPSSSDLVKEDPVRTRSWMAPVGLLFAVTFLFAAPNASAINEPCDDVCTWPASCSTACLDGGAWSTCGDYGVCTAPRSSDKVYLNSTCGTNRARSTFNVGMGIFDTNWRYKLGTDWRNYYNGGLCTVSSGCGRADTLTCTGATCYFESHNVYAVSPSSHSIFCY